MTESVVPVAADLLGVLLVVAVLFVAAWSRARQSEEFLVANRNLGLFPLVATLVMTEFNTSTLLAFSAAGYAAGPMALALPLVFLVGLTFYTLTVARAWKRFDRLSVAELFAERYSPALGRTASALLIVAMIGFSATYLKSFLLLISPWTGASVPWLWSGLLALVTLAVVFRGGLTAVVRTDVVGFILTVAVVCGLFLLSRDGSSPTVAPFPADQSGVYPLAQWQHPALPFRFVTTLIVLTCFTYIAAPWYGQKIFAARSERIAFRGVALAAVLVAVLYGMMVLAAAAYREQGGNLADSQLVVPAMIADWAPAWARGIGLGVLLVASLTTLSGVWSAMTAMVAADFGWTAARQVPVQRLLTVGFAVICWLGSNLVVDDILDRLILANIPVAGLAFALLAGFHWPRATTAAAWASIGVGVAWGVGCFVVVGEAGGYTWPWAIYGIPLIFATGGIVTLLSDRRSPPRADPHVSAS
ncbi:MAG: hypothetical protein SGI84_12030 [Gemmatimonadota bacterium]|nr:hypothetical protein [Gemmatimonadota bacterium]